ncbi:hypothetical protein [Streptomyces longispororuber]|nr:hypothetical protein [Streptomyces longispororuber]
MKIDQNLWESVFAGPKRTAATDVDDRFNDKAPESSDQGRFED